MAKKDRGRGRYRYRYRKDAGWDTDTRDRGVQSNCCGAERARCHTGKGSTPISIQTLIGLIGSYCLEAEVRRIVLLRRIFSHRGHRVHREILPLAVGETVRTSAGVLSDGK
jgi:hypothetical protein